MPAEHLSMAVAGQKGDSASVLEHYRRFLAFRRAHPAFAKGEIGFVAVEDGVVAFNRRYGNETILCIFNPGDTARAVESKLKTEPLSGHGFNSVQDGNTIKLEPYGAYFGRVV